MAWVAEQGSVWRGFADECPGAAAQQDGQQIAAPGTYLAGDQQGEGKDDGKKKGKDSGKLLIHFASNEEFERIAGFLRKAS